MNLNLNLILFLGSVASFLSYVPPDISNKIIYATISEDKNHRPYTSHTDTNKLVMYSSYLTTLVFKILHKISQHTHDNY